MMQNAELFALPPRAVTLLAGVPTPLCQPEPLRYCLTVVPGSAAVDLAVSPIPEGRPPAAMQSPNPLPIQVHGAAFPLLIGGVWWGYSGMNATVYVIETIRLKGA